MNQTQIAPSSSTHAPSSSSARLPGNVLESASRLARDRVTPRSGSHHQRGHRGIGGVDRDAQGGRRARLLDAVVHHPRVRRQGVRANRACPAGDRRARYDARGAELGAGTTPPRVVAALVLAVHVSRARVPGGGIDRGLRPHFRDDELQHLARGAADRDYGIGRAAAGHRPVQGRRGRFDAHGGRIHAEHDRRDGGAAMDAVSGLVGAIDRRAEISDARVIHRRLCGVRHHWRRRIRVDLLPVLVPGERLCPAHRPAETTRRTGGAACSDG